MEAGTPTDVDHPHLRAAALAVAQALGRTADWAHYGAWCAAHGFVPVPPTLATVSATVASLQSSHASATACRQLSMLDKTRSKMSAGVT